MRKFLLIGLLVGMIDSFQAQSYRGIVSLNDSICWVSGSKGTVLKTEDGGSTWDTLSPKGFSTKEFRDIHLYNPKTALVMSSGDSAVILKTTDGGNSWNVVHSNNRPGVFYDAMDAFGSFMVIVGDPYRPTPSSPRQFDFMASSDSGDTWSKSFTNNWAGLWEPDSGEALFAASGANLLLSYRGTFDPLHPDFEKLSYSLVTGGLQSAHYISGVRTKLPYPFCPTCGPYAQARSANNHLVVVGGNYLKPGERQHVALYLEALTHELQWSNTPPGGYRSGVAYCSRGNLWVCTGTNGSDISRDDGRTWKPLSIGGFNACTFSQNYLWLCGNKGQVKRIALEDIK